MALESYFFKFFLKTSFLLKVQLIVQIMATLSHFERDVSTQLDTINFTLTSDHDDLILNKKEEEEYASFFANPPVSTSDYLSTYDLILKRQNFINDTDVTQVVCLEEGRVNDVKIFKLPQNLDQFVKLIFIWSTKYLNNQTWPQDELLLTFNKPKKDTYKSLSHLIDANLQHIISKFYSKLVRSFGPNQRFQFKVIKSNQDKFWSLIKLERTFDHSQQNFNLNFGSCASLKLIGTNLSHFSAILYTKCLPIDENTFKETVWIQTYQVNLKKDEEVDLIPLFSNLNAFITKAKSMINIEASELKDQILNPILESSASGICLKLSKTSKLKYKSFDLDCIQKSIDTVYLSSQYSHFCCLDYYQVTDKYVKIVKIINAILFQFYKMNSMKSSERWVNHKIKTLIVTKKRRLRDLIVNKLQRTKLFIHLVCNQRERPKWFVTKFKSIAHNLLAKLMTADEYLNDQVWKQIYNEWDTIDQVKSSEVKDKLFELNWYAEVISVSHCDVAVGRIQDVYNDMLLNLSLHNVQFFVCIVVGASSFNWDEVISLLNYGCQKYILIDKDLGTNSNSIFQTFLKMYKQNDQITKEVKTCVVSQFKSNAPISSLQPSASSTHSKTSTASQSSPNHSLKNCQKKPNHDYSTFSKSNSKRPMSGILDSFESSKRFSNAPNDESHLPSHSSSTLPSCSSYSFSRYSKEKSYFLSNHSKNVSFTPFSVSPPHSGRSLSSDSNHFYPSNDHLSHVYGRSSLHSSLRKFAFTCSLPF